MYYVKVCDTKGGATNLKEQSKVKGPSIEGEIVQKGNYEYYY
jgi:hypothetical protein